MREYVHTYVRACICTVLMVSFLWHTVYIIVAVSVSTLYGIQLWCVCASKSGTLPTCSACVHTYIYLHIPTYTYIYLHIPTYVRAVPSVCACVLCAVCVLARVGMMVLPFMHIYSLVPLAQTADVYKENSPTGSRDGASQVTEAQAQ